MTEDWEGLARSLRPHYADFLPRGRVLMTGHSHQAWPAVAREGLIASYQDAALLTDEKWSRAFERADRIRRGISERIGGRPAEIAFASSTHELVVRFLSAVDLRKRPHIVTTRGEFHSLDRQLRRLSEEGIAVTFVDPYPVTTLAERLAAAITERTAAVMASTVLFETSARVPHLEAVTARAHQLGAAVLFDAYHAFQAVPFTVTELGPDPVFVVAGGYKYAQWGEGVCFLRVPPGNHRPIDTGWFADFAHLAAPDRTGPVTYGPDGANQFGGSTYDPASHYRAAAVLDFFDAQSLTVPRLRQASLAKTTYLLEALDGLDIVTPRDPDLRSGFIAIRLKDAEQVATQLRARNILTDVRNHLLRLGPAPYTTKEDLDTVTHALLELT